MTVTPYARALSIGAVAGMRSMTAPASTLFVHDRRLARVARYAALGELIADKLPFIPARTALPSLAFRVVIGGVCGDAVARGQHASRAGGIALGALGAVAGTYLGYALRSYVTRRRLVPGVVVALVEDAIAVTAARAIAAAA
jgi:uncharacterized membrane protein